MSTSYDFTDLDHATVGAVGDPGRRVFLLQVQAGAELVTFKLEKQQLAAISEYFGRMLVDLPGPGHLPDDMALRQPLEIAWIVGNLEVTYEDSIDRVSVIAEEAQFQSDDEDSLSSDLSSDEESFADDLPEPATLRLRLTREQAAAIAIFGVRLVQSGRPPCPLCGHPLDPAGHACPRTNGYRPPAP